MLRGVVGGGMGCMGAWVRGWHRSKFGMGGMGSMVWNFGIGGMGQKNEVQQKNGMGLNALLFNHIL